MATANINGRQLHYLDQGKGFPILFGHSFLWDAAMWQPQIDSLKSKFRCIVPELPSHGQAESLNDSSPYTIEMLANDHLALLDHLKIDKCIVVGLSVGGMWGAKLAIDHPNRVAGLVLSDTYLGEEPEETRHSYGQLTDALEQVGQFADPLLDAVVPLFFAPKTYQTNPQLPSSFKERLASMDKTRIPGVCAVSRGVFSRVSLLEQLPKITQPTLVLVGENDIPRPPSEAKEMASLFPNSELKIISDAGHISNLENPKGFNQALEVFLEGITISRPEKAIA